jgi:hypothetical protein
MEMGELVSAILARITALVVRQQELTYQEFSLLEYSSSFGYDV